MIVVVVLVGGFAVQFLVSQAWWESIGKFILTVVG